MSTQTFTGPQGPRAAKASQQPSYVPILKAKRGEFSALAQLSETIKDLVLPLFEVPPIDWTKNKDGALVRKRPPGEHLSAVVEKVRKAWPGRRFLVDIADAKLPEFMPDGRHSVTFLFDLLRAAGLQGVPVFRLTSSMDTLRAVLGVVETDGHGACLRARRSEGMFANTFDRVGAGLLRALRVAVAECDLLLDGDDFSASDAHLMAAAFGQLLRGSALVASARTVIVAGSSFPQSLADNHAADSVGAEQRGEWLMWRLLNSNGRLPRTPTFADYGIAHPAHLDTPPWLLKASANIRYTLDDHWLIARGRTLAKHGNGQFHTLARHVANHVRFRGRAFSSGDAYIVDCASGAQGGGNLEVWRRVGTNHHITEVVRQLQHFAIPLEP